MTSSTAAQSGRPRSPLSSGQGRIREIAPQHMGLQAARVADSLIERGEIVALLFNVSDIADTLTKIERLLRGGDEEEEADEG